MSGKELQQISPPARQTGCRGLFVECLILLVGGLLLALAANQMSPRGLTLTRNYFPATGSQTTVTHATNVVSGTHINPADAVAAQVAANGLQLVTSKMVIQLFQDPRYAMEQIVFVDARDEKHFAEGHIPGAYQFDHYRKEDYLANIIPPCLMAEQVVVYCTGGNCEDSLNAAVLLRDAGVGREKLFVYAGGIHDWTSNSLPVEVGARKSGLLRTNSAASSTAGPAK